MNQDLNASDLQIHLKGCGYLDNLLRTDYHFSSGESVPLIGFANSPADARSACIVAINVLSDPCALVTRCRELGAPIVFTCFKRELQWWKQGRQNPECIKVISSDDVPGFFQHHKKDFSPEAVYRAKTWGRFDRQYQLSFVDVGLMPLVECQIGESLGNLIARTVSALKTQLGWHTLTNDKSDWLLKSVFWLLAAKILRDKKVPSFSNIDLLAVDEVFAHVATHYGTKIQIEIRNNRQRNALINSASTIKQFSDLGLTTTESLAYVYENTLISNETRSALGTHSTPSYLVDYILGKLDPWIREIPEENRNVFEPACGHAAFLIATMRLLRELLTEDFNNVQKQRSYLRKRLHGCEIDAFALEIALLS
ncbi:MAG: N-6 DNA methylase, partial [Thermoguttaceae bacterium]